MGRSVLVTGATGFIGSRLVRRLADNGARVHAVVPPGDARERALRSLPGVTLHRLPVFDAGGLRACVSGDAPELVFHLAASGVNPAEREPSALLAGNTGLLVELLVACRELRPRRVIFTGSCSEYAPVVPGSRVHEDDPRDATDLYGAAKVATHLYGRALAVLHELPLVTLRLFGTYGPGEAPHRLIPYLVKRLRASEPVDLTRGEQVRDLTFVDDVVEALLVAGATPELGAHDAFNVCSGRGVSVRQLCAEVVKQLGCSETLLGFGARPYRRDEPMWLVGNPQRFQHATAWSPRVSLEQGIARTLQEIG
jgi:UDP-glucose 4-epimerase